MFDSLANDMMSRRLEEEDAEGNLPVPTECTFNTTGPQFSIQKSYQCSTCYPEGNKGVCLFCAIECDENDHKLGEPIFSSFFCDKGNDKTRITNLVYY